MPIVMTTSGILCFNKRKALYKVNTMATTPSVFEKATACAGFNVERSGTELTFVPDIRWTSRISDEYKQRPWKLDAPLDESVIYTAEIGGYTAVRLIAQPSGNKDWTVLQSNPACGLMVPATHGDSIDLEIKASFPIGKHKTMEEQVLLAGSFECPEHHSVMSSPGYTIMDTSTSKLMAFLSVADVAGATHIVSVSVNCNLEDVLWE